MSLECDGVHDGTGECGFAMDDGGKPGRYAAYYYFVDDVGHHLTSIRPGHLSIHHSGRSHGA